MRDGPFDIAFLKQLTAEIMFCHPATWIPLDGRSPECLDVAITQALPPGEYCQRAEDQNTKREKKPWPKPRRFGELHQTSGNQCDRTDAGEILVMVRHERVAKRVEHDESQHRTESREEERRGDLDAPSKVASGKIDRYAQGDARDEPHIGQGIVRGDRPLRVDERQFRRPKYFPQIKPCRVSGHN